MLMIIEAVSNCNKWELRWVIIPCCKIQLCQLDQLKIEVVKLAISWSSWV